MRSIGFLNLASGRLVYKEYEITGPSEGGLGGFSPPNNLLKFADFVSEKGCESQRCKIEDSNLYIFEEATRI